MGNSSQTDPISTFTHLPVVQMAPVNLREKSSHVLRKFLQSFAKSPPPSTMLVVCTGLTLQKLVTVSVPILFYPSISITELLHLLMIAFSEHQITELST